MPASQTRRDRLAQVFGQDALALCQAAWVDGAPGWIREIEAVHCCGLVQTCLVRSDSRGRQVIKKRDADDGVPSGQLRLASPYDADARWAVKGDDLFWMGYKIHLTETCATLPDAGAGAVPNLITDVHTTDATVPDVKATAPIWTTPPKPGPPKASTRAPSASTGRPVRSAAPPARPALTGTRSNSTAPMPS
ncbi:hypothetical protein ACGFX8_35420 [Streptomyces sp. NPDC048362]|uniref:hypothetical protein n=1 Tax=Streptomyces sp. NPDC048362 TaxID=3365539 RepID=UPI003718A753